MSADINRLRPGSRTWQSVKSTGASLVSSLWRICRWAGSSVHHLRSALWPESRARAHAPHSQVNSFRITEN